jgi:hypothetical protein
MSVCLISTAPVVGTAGQSHLRPLKVDHHNASLFFEQHVRMPHIFVANTLAMDSLQRLNGQFA